MAEGGNHEERGKERKLMKPEIESDELNDCRGYEET